MDTNLQCLKTLKICYLRLTEYHTKNRTSLRSLDFDTFFLNDPLYFENCFSKKNLNAKLFKIQF